MRELILKMHMSIDGFVAAAEIQSETDRARVLQSAASLKP